MWKIWLKHEHLQMIQNNERKGHCFFTLTILDYYNYSWMVLHFSVSPTRLCSFTASMYRLKLERFKRNSLLRMFLWPIKDLYLGTCTCNLWHKVMQSGGRARKRNTNPSDICCGAVAKSGGEAVPVRQPLLQIAVGLLLMPALIMWASRWVGGTARFLIRIH